MGLSIPYTKIERSKIFDSYKQANKKSGWLDLLSKEINRPKSNICRFAKNFGLTIRNRSDKSKIITIICPVCLKGFKRKKYNNKIYCSKECRRIKTSKERSKIMKKWYLTHSVSEELKIRTSINFKKMWADPNHIVNSKSFRDNKSMKQSNNMIKRIQQSPNSIYSRTQKGWSIIGDKRCFFRSGWEVKYATYLQSIKDGGGIIDWEYEPETFWFEKIKRGVRSYTPDFKIKFADGEIQFHEVKGWMDSKSKTKIKRMAKYYPKISLTIIEQKEMKSLGLI